MKGVNRCFRELLSHCYGIASGGRKKSPHKSSQHCKLRQHKGRLAGAELGGWAGARSAVSPPRPARRAQRARSCPRAPRTWAPRSGGGSGRTPGALGLQRSRDCTLPGRPHATEAPVPSLPRRHVCSRGRPSGRNRARPHLCAFSGAARGGQRQRRRGRSASPRRARRRRRRRRRLPSCLGR